MANDKDAEEPKKPTQTKKGMDKPTAPSASKSPQDEQQLMELKEITNQLKNIKDNDREQRKEMVTALTQLTAGLKKAEETPEEKKEKKSAFAKAMAKLGETFKASFKGFKSIKDLLKGSLGPLKTFWDAVKKVKKFILAFLGAFILKNLSLDDVKKMWEGVKDALISLKKLFIAMMEFLTPLWEWWIKEEGGFDQTVKLFKKTFEGFATMLKEITDNFDGFQEKGFKGKMIAITKTVESIGKFVMTFFFGVFDFVAAAFGYKSESGSITKDIGTFLEKTFSPGFMDGVKSVFATVLGAMAIARIFGVSPITFMTKFAGLIWKGIRGIFTLVRLALSPVGIGLSLAALGAVFSNEVIRGIENFVGEVRVGFKNLWADLHNKLADTWLGKKIGMEKKKKIVWDDEVEAKKYEAKEMKGIAGLEGEIKRMELHKELSKLPGARGKAELLQAGFKGKFEDDGTLEQKKSELKEKKLDLQDFQSIWASKLGYDPTETKSPYRPELLDDVKKKITDVGTGALDELREFGKAKTDKVIKGPLPSIEGFEGFGKAGRPGFSYDDGEGFRTIGYGFNMDKPNAEALMKAAGITKNFKDLYDGKIALTEAEGKKLKESEMAYFTASAKAWIGADKWNKMNVGAQNALVDMAYNMGGNFTGKKKDGTFKWGDLRTALRSGDMDAVGPAIRDSNYINQVQKERSGANISALSKAYQQYDYKPSQETMDKQASIINSMQNIQNIGDNVNYSSNDSAKDPDSRTRMEILSATGSGIRT